MLRASVALLALVGFLTSATAAPPTGSASPDPKSLAVPPEELSKARVLVQKLASEDFQDREAAERDLATMGRLARAAILDGVNLDPDPEVRARCRTLLTKATNEEMKARLATFMADTDGKYEHELPGWHKMRAVVRGEWKMFGWTYTARPGADKAARALFIEFMDAPGGRQMLAALNGDPADLSQLVTSRKQELYNAKYPRTGGISPRNPSIAEIGVVVLGDALTKSTNARNTYFTNVLSTSGISSMLLGGDDKAQAMKAVMNAWFDSRTDPYEMYTAFNLASQMNAPESISRLAIKLMTTAGVPGAYKGQALMTIVRQKMTDQIPTLEKTFTDATVLTSTVQLVDGKRVVKSITVGDAALAAAIVMSGQDPNDYGFDAFPKAAAGGTFSYVWAKIPEEKRKEAIEKWNKWREKNP